jgi:hypothetical protein
MDIIDKMKGQSVFSYSFKWKDKVVTLATTSAVKFNEDRTIDLSLLFQRFLIVSQSGELSLKDVLNYELSTFPLALPIENVIGIPPG